MCDLNENNIKSAVSPSILRDANIKGLHLRVSGTKKAFYLYYRSKAGVERRPKLGNYGDITLSQARKTAKELLAKVSLGEDPSLQIKEGRAAPILVDLWNEYWKAHGRFKKSCFHDQDLWGRIVCPALGKKRVNQLTYKEISAFANSLRSTPIQANRTVALLSKMFSFAQNPLKWTSENPCKGIKRNPENKRRRYLTVEETQRLSEKLTEALKTQPQSAVFLYLLLYTGARCGEIAAAKWEHLEGNVLRLPDSKTGAKSIFLPKPAMDIISTLPRTTGTIVGIQSPKRLWDRLRIEIEAPDLRMHDLRHNFASVALGAGFGLAQIGELLGHKSAQTTKRYAHLVEEAALSAAEVTAKLLTEKMSSSSQ